MHRFAIPLLLALAGSASLQAAEIGLTPIALHLDRDHDRTLVRVENRGSEPVTMQADAINWSRQATNGEEASTDALMVSPPIFRIGPGQTQIVRVGLRRTTTLAQEATYRMVLREIPRPADAGDTVSGSVQVLVALRVPVYVAPQQPRREARWRVRSDAQGQVTAEVTNDGNVHLLLASLHLHDGSSRTLATHAGPAMVWPGESQRFALRPSDGSRSSPDGAMVLEVLTDRGLQRVAVESQPN
jgi:fimbrial chaperone protein